MVVVLVSSKFSMSVGVVVRVYVMTYGDGYDDVC